ncbi:MAG: response regulator, partial [Syntrophomonadaceae bacterium]|nr:response regulator [Syntrophomonadaceae bacterium]
MRVLVVHRDSRDRSASGDLFPTAGGEVVTCYSVREGLEALSAHDFDLVFIDVRMTKAASLLLLSALQARPGGAQVPTVLFTGVGTAQSATEGLLAGGYDSLVRPGRSDSLAQLLKKAAGGTARGKAKRRVRAG